MQLIPATFSRLPAVLLLLLATTIPATADGLGPVAVRNQLPFNQLVLQLTPGQAETLQRGATDVSFSLSWSNTFIMSRSIEDWIETHRTPMRNRLAPGEIDRILSETSDHDLYFFDGEVARWGLRLRYGLTDRLQLTLDTALQSRDGGFADSSIEAFHHSFGLGNADRDYFPQDDFLVFLHANDHQFYRDRKPSTFAPADTTLSLKLKGGSRWRGWRSAIAAAIKLPTGSADNYGGSGNPDGQIALYGSRPTQSGAIHFNLAYTALGGIDKLPIPTASHIESAVLAWETWNASHHLNWVFQGAWSTSLFNGAIDSDLADPTWLFTAGLRIPVGRHDLLSFAVIENVAQFDNSTDIAMHIAYRHDLSHLSSR